MASKRTSIQMTDDEVTAYLADVRTMNVATIGPDGRIHLVAMWYGFENGKLAFWTFGRSQKIKNLERSNRLTCLVESGTEYAQLRGVEIVGTAEIVRDTERIVAIGMNTSERHTGVASADAEAFIRHQAIKRLGVVITVDSIVSWDHRKLGGVY